MMIRLTQNMELFDKKSILSIFDILLEPFILKEVSASETINDAIKLWIKRLQSSIIPKGTVIWHVYV